MQAIAATSYEGYVGHEYRPKDDPMIRSNTLSPSVMSEKPSEAMVGQRQSIRR